MEEEEEYSELFEKGLELLRTRKHNESLSVFKKCVKMKPKCHKALKMLGDLLWWNNDFLESLNYLNKAIEIHSNDYEYFRCRGRTYRSMNKYNEAIKDCESSLEITSEYSQPYSTLALCYKNSGNYEKAFEIADIACTKKQVAEHDYYFYYPDPFWERGRIHKEKMNHEKAIEDLCRSISYIKSENYRFKDSVSRKNFALKSSYSLRGDSEMCFDMFPEALEDFDKAIKYSETDEDKSLEYYNRGHLHLEHTLNYGQGVKEFTKAIELHKYDGAYYHQRAICYARLEEFRKSLKDCDTSIFISSFKKKDQGLKELFEDWKRYIVTVRDKFYSEIKSFGNSELTFNEELANNDEKTRFLYLTRDDSDFDNKLKNIVFWNGKLENIPEIFFILE